MTMPSPEDILSGLKEIANNWRPLAILWHGFFGVGVLAFLSGVRPSRQVAGFLLAFPLLSVSVLAWANANPFNGAFFAILALALLAICFRVSPGSAEIAPVWLVIVGALMVVFGWVYPHFLDTSSALSYLYAAPTGLIPCPTLSVVIGFSLVLGGLDSRSWSLVLAAAGIFYGIFGALRLGVMIDFVLLAGALLIAIHAFSPTTIEVPVDAIKTRGANGAS